MSPPWATEQNDQTDCTTGSSHRTSLLRSYLQYPFTTVSSLVSSIEVSLFFKTQRLIENHSLSDGDRSQGQLVLVLGFPISQLIPALPSTAPWIPPMRSDATRTDVNSLGLPSWMVFDHRICRHRVRDAVFPSQEYSGVLDPDCPEVGLLLEPFHQSGNLEIFCLSQDSKVKREVVPLERGIEDWKYLVTKVS